MSAGVYTYTIAAVPPCAGASSTVTVTVNAPSNAGTSTTLSVCDQGSAVALLASLPGADGGGSWSGPSPVVGGQYDPVTMTPGAYVYTVTGTPPCANAQATVTVSETGTPNAGINGVVTLCSTDAAVDLAHYLTGADGGGTWSGPSPIIGSLFDPATMSAGVYTYTIAAVPPCAGASSTVTVTVNAPPNAGTSATLSVCDQGSAVALLASLPGADGGGTWSGPSPVVGGQYDPVTMTPGAYVYTVTGTSPCANAQATVTVNETSTPNAGINGTVTLCATDAAVDLSHYLTGADVGGTWSGPSPIIGSLFDPATMTAGVYTYAIAAVPPCAGDAATVTVTVQQPPRAGVSGARTVCAGDAPFALIAVLGATADAGGSWTGPGGLAVSDTFDPASSAPGTYTYTVGSAVCGQVSATATIGVSAGPNAGQDSALPLCGVGQPVDLFAALGGTPDAGGTWVGPDGPIADAGFDPASDRPGAYTYTVGTTTTCPDASATVTVTVSAPPNAGSPGAVTLCSTSDAIDLFHELGGSPDAGGVWAGPDTQPFNGTFDPAVGAPGAYTYTVAGVPPCPSASASVTVGVEHAPDAGADAEHAFCASDATVSLLTLLGGTPDANGTWRSANGSAVADTFDPSSGAAGVYTYHLDAVAPCVADEASLTITIARPVSAGADSTVTFCSDHDPVALIGLLNGTPDAGGTWMDPNGAVSDGRLDPSSMAAGDYTYTVTAEAPCPQAVAVVHATILAAPDAQITAIGNGSCAPAEVHFASTYTGGGSCSWDLGNGTLVNDCAPQVVTYDSAATYAVTLTIDGGNGCVAMFTVDGGVQVLDAPIADFRPLAEHLNADHPLVMFVNQSQGATAYAWDYAGLGSSTDEQGLFTFPQGREGLYTICLVAYASSACTDTLCQDLRIPLAATVNAPNAFTPNGDGVNDSFAPVLDGVDPDEYQLYIFDRWGQRFFSTTRIEDRWTGVSPGGSPAPQDVYVWRLIGRDQYTKDRFEKIGHVTLVR
ncbi:MAG: gliding motility-associated C-terminal domain-containing protein [Flavobacteriales bacterium]